MASTDQHFSGFKPCDICQIGSISSQRHAAVADWNVFGYGLNVEFLICEECKHNIERLGLKHKNPIVVITHLIATGLISRPSPEAYLGHPQWQKVWNQFSSMVDPTSGLTADSIKEIEQQLIDRIASQVVDERTQKSEVRLFDLLSKVTWNMSEDEVLRVFGHKLRMDDHPSMNAVGFVDFTYGVFAGMGCYFLRGESGSDRLSRVVVTFFKERPEDEVIEEIYATIKGDTVSRYGKPTKTERNFEGFPDAFRQSELLIWSLADSILTLSIALQRDGVLEDSPCIAIGLGDRKRDPVSQGCDFLPPLDT